MTCTFFGHRDCSSDVREKLKAAIENLIAEKGVDIFYVGNQGNFDVLVLSVLRELKNKYHIKYSVVLAYMPKNTDNHYGDGETIFPESVAKAHPKFAISKRNKWMINEADYVISYVVHRTGGAERFAEMAGKKNREIINIGEKFNVS